VILEGEEGIREEGDEKRGGKSERRKRAIQFEGGELICKKAIKARKGKSYSRRGRKKLSIKGKGRGKR